jgi:hypothetical protein
MAEHARGARYALRRKGKAGIDVVVSAPTVSRLLSWTLAFAVMVAALIWPALWNGFPLVFYDTGGYLVRPFERTLGLGRAAMYGLFLATGVPLGFWPNALAQGTLVAWLLVLALRAHGLGGRPWLAAAVTVALALLSGLPWYAAQLMPDVLVPVAVLALYLLAFADAHEGKENGRSLRRWEKALLVGSVAFAIACHMATLALAAGLLLVLFMWRAFSLPPSAHSGASGNPEVGSPLARERAGNRIAKLVAEMRERLPLPRIVLPAAAVALGILLAPASNYAVAGRFAFTPGGANFIFSHLFDEGLVARYLAERCPDPSLRLCAYRDRLPASGNDWMWEGDTPLWKDLGGPDAFADEASRLVREIATRYPGAVIKAAVGGAVRQFVLIRTGDGLVSDAWHTVWAIETYAPKAAAAFRASRQQQDRLAAETLTAIHTPVALAAMFALPLVIGLGYFGRVSRHASAFALFVLLALVANAAICGIFSIPAWRYQSRLVPIAPFAVIVAGLARRSARRALTRRDIGVSSPP